MKKESKIFVPDEAIMGVIYNMRGKNVMLDRDLAKLYDVETRRLKEQVKRNISRFPDDFMFEFSKKELVDWRNQFGGTNREIMGLRIAPYAFTEHGVLMLASVLNSERAVQVNIQIVRIFTKMKEMLLTQEDVLVQLEQIQHGLSCHDEHIMQIFEYLKQLEKAKQEVLEYKNRPRVGFKQVKID
ncbi:MAG: ORF6N domain-containing protein [Bacteroidales bacterium]|nr:ORF6N domain-containing protein [Bacteroidales bacterium]